MAANLVLRSQVRDLRNINTRMNEQLKLSGLPMEREKNQET